MFFKHIRRMLTCTGTILVLASTLCVAPSSAATWPHTTKLYPFFQSSSMTLGQVMVYTSFSSTTGQPAVSLLVSASGKVQGNLDSLKLSGSLKRWDQRSHKWLLYKRFSASDTRDAGKSAVAWSYNRRFRVKRSGKYKLSMTLVLLAGSPDAWSRSSSSTQSTVTVG